MLFAIDGKAITEVPRTRTEYFRAVRDTLLAETGPKKFKRSSIA